MINPEEFRQYLAIDKTNLDNELVQQAQLFYDVSEALVSAIDIRDTLKEDLAVADAELDSLLRVEHEKADERYSEASIKGEIRTHKTHLDAFELFAKAKKNADRLSALKESFIQRSHAIKHLCELYVANYYENNSFKGTDRTDTATYMQQRERLAAGRQERKGR